MPAIFNDADYEQTNVVQPCDLCGLEKARALRGNGGVKLWCLRCGCFRLNTYYSLSDESKPILSAATRQAWENGIPLLLDSDSIPGLHTAHFGSTPSDRVGLTLKYLAKRSVRLGESARLDLELDLPVADASSSAELVEYIKYLSETGMIRVNYTISGVDCWVTIPGWESLQPKQKKGGTPGTCFIAMAFNQSLNEAYEAGIRAAVEQDCGFNAIRIDRIEHNDQVTDRIMAGIRDCQFMVADFTLQRNGVYYEAGFAKGLGRTVISCCRKDEISGLHFDTKIINHIAWSDPADLRTKLTNRIKATIIEPS